MEIDKFKKWIDVAQQFQTDHFWNKVFKENKHTTLPTPLSNPLAIGTFPKCDLYELDQQLVLEAEIPGVRKEDLHISIQQQRLTISGNFHTFEQNKKYYFKERANHQFKKEITLPFPIFKNQIRTEIHNGVLAIFMPFHHNDAERIPISFN